MTESKSFHVGQRLLADEYNEVPVGTRVSDEDSEAWFWEKLSDGSWHNGFAVFTRYMSPELLASFPKVRITYVPEVTIGVEEPETIIVTDDPTDIGSPEWAAMTRTLSRGGEFATPNGEYPDAHARGVAWAYGDRNPTLRALGRGERVGRDALIEAVGEVGRRAGWPRVLEYLATWVLNHE